ncbi:hypothetical protein EWM64_g2716 [Hericium alpestre]|uniref:BZIP domain-containing protein n=1 Tax=Hericium alpestre TaxID=135208 RepID=A0A4Z0A6L1_9AGAM|nr:hypothetical protein EWM64_g2716 [Hericium alpestre]
MLVDNPLQQSPFTMNNPDISEFFNLELMLGGNNVQQQASSSRSSSHSPLSTFSTLPSPHAPFSPNIAVPDSQAHDFFNFYLEDDYTKVDPLAPPPMPISAAPFDFLVATLLHRSTTYEHAFAFEALSDIDEHEEDEAGHEDDDESSRVSIPPVKVGGKGKGRRGTVQSGGVQKKTASVVSAVVRNRDFDDDKEDDWRPSPEEYKKMSSKEKRQLRNKISARNFRVRRKEYITTLEGDIAERDRLIDAIRNELGSTKNENAALRNEISTLKKALLAGAGRSESPMLPPPGPIPAPARPASTTPALVTPNTHKDLPMSPRIGSGKGFWGGSAPFGGITPVHTTLIPESFAQPLVGVKPSPSKSPALQENINPSLNGGNFTTPAAFGEPVHDEDARRLPHAALDTHGSPATTAQLLPIGQGATAPITGLASNLRPSYFTSPSTSKTTPPSTSSLSSLLAGKHYPTPPASPSAAAKRDAETAMIAAMASQTLIGRLGSAFWDAFSGSSSANKDAGAFGRAGVHWDADKVRRVLEGKAVVQVVDIDEKASAPAPRSAVRKVQSVPQMQDGVKKEGPCDCLQKTLEESMRALSIGKKN